jgi:hypothetical protein
MLALAELLGALHEAAEVHCTYRLDGGVAARGAPTAASVTGNRVSQRLAPS